MQSALCDFEIVNGYEISIKERPFQVSINDEYIPFFYANHHCGGSIISKKFVITAAHCVDDRADRSGYVVREGTADSTWFGDIYYINKISIHQNYTYRPLRYDIALMEIIGEIVFSENVQPIELAYPNFLNYNGLLVYASGYGSKCYKCPFTEKLMQITVGTVALEECKVYRPTVLENMICAKDPRNISTSK